jgi:hypothetical protein
VKLALTIKLSAALVNIHSMAVARATSGLDIRKALSRRVVDLYRRMCREVRPVRTMYQIDETPAEIRHMVLLQFRKNNAATDPRIIDMLISRGEMELEETRNQWKQRGHLMALIKPELPPADPMLDPEEFFKRFLDGTLDEPTIWRRHIASQQHKTLKVLAAQVAKAGGAPDTSIIGSQSSGEFRSGSSVLA